MISTTKFWAQLTGNCMPGKPMTVPCVACGTKPDIGGHPFELTDTFTEHLRFRGPIRMICGYCRPVMEQGDRIAKTSKPKSWVLSQARITELTLKEASRQQFWFEQIMNPPEPPFVMTMQRAKSVRYLLLFTAPIGLSQDWFPVTMADHQVAWISPSLVTHALEYRDQLAPVRELLMAGRLPYHSNLQWLSEWTIPQRRLLAEILPYQKSPAKGQPSPDLGQSNQSATDSEIKQAA